jgi:hypothetical protein
MATAFELKTLSWKVCPGPCLEMKPLTEFYARDRLCKVCRCAQDIKRRADRKADDPAAISEYYRQKHNRQRNRMDLIDPRLWWAYRGVEQAKCRARKAKPPLPFDITVEQVLSIAPDVCPVLKFPLRYDATRRQHPYDSASLDKVIPELGYVFGNVAVISYKANRLKSDGTPDELDLVAQWSRAAHTTALRELALRA